MNRGLNKVILIGEVVRDPEMRYTPSGKPVTSFLLSTSRTWNTSDGEKHLETERFHIVTFGNLAELCSQRLEKGLMIFIEGRLQSRRWEDREGTRHNSVEVHALEMILLSEQPETQSQMDVGLINMELDEMNE